jgi:hypothetical protein
VPEANNPEKACACTLPAGLFLTASMDFSTHLPQTNTTTFCFRMLSRIKEQSFPGFFVKIA